MLGKLYPKQECSAARALEIVGERWSLLILRDAMFRGYTRFSEFERSLGIAPNILSKRLEAFVDADIMRVGNGADGGDAGEYALTPRGRALRTVIMALTEWGDAWVRAGPIEYVDAKDERVELAIRRKSDGSAIVHDDVSVRLRQ